MMSHRKNLFVAVAGNQNCRKFGCPFSQHRDNLPANVNAAEKIAFNNKQAVSMTGIEDGIKSIENIRLAPNDTSQPCETTFRPAHCILQFWRHQ